MSFYESFGDWVADIDHMQHHFDITGVKNEAKLKDFLDFRIKFLEEELNEIKSRRDDPEEVVDGLIDICVVAIGTLLSFRVDAQKAWKEVLEANLAKNSGVNPNRPNPFGHPDLIKPEGWQAPDHSGNVGLLWKLRNNG